MLSRITIQNLGLIDCADISFSEGFTVITGETGAGKSFFCNALEIGLGERIKKLSSQKTVVEVLCFHHIFRRVIDSQKSRFFIDDIPETLEKAEDILQGKFYFHRQHNTHFFSSSAAVDLFDAAMNKKKEKEHFAKCYAAWKNAKKNLETITAECEKMNDLKSFWEFSLEQLSAIDITEEQVQEAEELVNSESMAADVISAYKKALHALSDEETGAMTQVGKAEEALHSIRHAGATVLADILSALSKLVLELEKTMPMQHNDIDLAKAFLLQVQKWCKQHGVINAQNLIEKKQKLIQQLQDLHAKEQEKIQLELVVHTLQQEAIDSAKVLSACRKEFIPYFQDRITKTCQDLGMLPAEFVVQVQPCDICASGIEKIDFLFSANKNQPLMPLSSVASGGEKSRIMLALYEFTPEKSVIIFDEIDTGVSGSVAEKMASVMKRLAKTRQIIAITHLATIAAQADHHLVVMKTHEAEKSITTITKVEGDDRIEAIAQMISGAKSEEGKKMAQELMQQ